MPLTLSRAGSPSGFHWTRLHSGDTSDSRSLSLHSQDILIVPLSLWERVPQWHSDIWATQLFKVTAVLGITGG